MPDPKIIDIGKMPDPLDDNKRNSFFEPLSNRGIPRWIVLLMGVLGLIYILNPTFGLLEFIPDNLPIVGNLDEGAAFLLVMYGIIELVQGKTRD